MNFALGGGVSSRLFQRIREERGLAYSVVSERSAYHAAGCLAVSVGTSPENAQEVLSLVLTELDDVAATGITQRELEVAVGHLRADTLLSLEDSGSRMSRIGGSLLLHDEVLTIDEVISRIEAVTLEEIRERAAPMLAEQRVLAVVGPFDEGDFSSHA